MIENLFSRDWSRNLIHVTLGRLSILQSYLVLIIKIIAIISGPPLYYTVLCRSKSRFSPVLGSINNVVVTFLGLQCGQMLKSSKNSSPYLELIALGCVLSISSITLHCSYIPEWVIFSSGHMIINIPPGPIDPSICKAVSRKAIKSTRKQDKQTAMEPFIYTFIIWNGIFSYCTALLSHRPIKLLQSNWTMVRATIFIFWSKLNADLYWSFNATRLFPLRLDVRTVGALRTYRKTDTKYR